MTTLPLAPAAAPEATPRVAAAASYLDVDTTLRSWLLTTDHKRIGILYLFTLLATMALGGFFALAAPHRAPHARTRPS